MAERRERKDKERRDGLPDEKQPAKRDSCEKEGLDFSSEGLAMRSYGDAAGHEAHLIKMAQRVEKASVYVRLYLSSLPPSLPSPHPHLTRFVSSSVFRAAAAPIKNGTTRKTERKIYMEGATGTGTRRGSTTIGMRRRTGEARR